jgi:hypothetical protein
MSCGPRCEQSSWIFGVAGMCNETSQRCVCPPGYDGKDDFQDWNDCHIRSSLSRSLHSMVFGLALLTAVFSGFGLVYTSRRGGGVFVLWWHARRFARGDLESLREGGGASVGGARAGKCESGGSSLLDATVTAGGGGEEACGAPADCQRAGGVSSRFGSGSTSASVKAERQSRDASLRQFGMLFLFFCFGLTTCVFQFYMLLPQPVHLYDGVVVQRLAYFFAASSMIVGLWQVTHMLYASLPNMGVFGPMFGISNVFTQYPYLVRKFTSTMGVITSLLLLVTTVVLPLSDPANSYQVASTAVMAVDSLIWFVSMIVVCYVLDKVFVVGIEAVRATSAVEGSVRSVFARQAERSFIRARATIRYTIILVVLLGLIALACLAMILIVPVLSSNIFFPFSVIGAIACLGCLALTYLMVFRSAFLKSQDEQLHQRQQQAQRQQDQQEQQNQQGQRQQNQHVCLDDLEYDRGEHDIKNVAAGLEHGLEHGLDHPNVTPQLTLT